MLLNEFLKEHRQVQDQSAEIGDLQQKLAALQAMVEQLAEKR